MSNSTYIIKDYGKKSTFASFLPGIAGIHGTPIWCYYVNRGQGVVSFGVDNKDHAIMEFYPAHKAYQNVKTTGFRTFLKVNGKNYEAFSDEEVKHQMEIAMNNIKITETNDESGIETKVTYFTLPEEKVGGLVRIVEIKNTKNEEADVEVLDGMPALIPYGVCLEDMTEITQTVKAWMQVEDVDKNLPYFRVRASIKDSTVVTRIEGGNFAAATLLDGKLLKPIVDPSVVFGYDVSCQKAVAFNNTSLDELMNKKQIAVNQVPCCFYGTKASIKPQESILIYEIYGQVENKDILNAFFAEERNADYFNKKLERADYLTEELGRNMETSTASKEFDAYCEYDYMDNVLRGGYPIKLGNNKIFYVYSRKHGDLERDYNYFSMLPEFYSQGNGNFRDVNQNRRCDTFFAPFVGTENIKEFYSLIQLDGYNPLQVEKLTYELSDENAEEILKATGSKEIAAFVKKPFTPGALYKVLEKELKEADIEEVFISIIDKADGLVNGNFGEGYWADHWTYNLDLIKDYLEVFPEREKEMLYENEYTTFLSQININHREKKYVETENGVRQYYCLDEEGKRTTKDKLVRTKNQTGDVLKMTLLEKLVLLCTSKFAALDSYGMGVEMEGGKPGWYDALNGMPAMVGSTMSESYELARSLEYTIDALKKYSGSLNLIEEFYDYLLELDKINKEEKEDIYKLEGVSDKNVISEKGEIISFWNKINDLKESYRDKVYAGISGNKKEISTDVVCEILEGFAATVKCGINKALVLGQGISPTYFTYDMVEYEKTENGIKPLKFKVEMVPYFLEGPVRYLKLNESIESKEALYKNVKNSDLYDEKLSMYKVNASLADASYEYGRAKAFTPGWLENESIWLHMEYKYLLELIRNGMYEDFFTDFHNAAVPFLDSEVYGRSIYENSSFIASSVNPNEAYHGKGFVARLSGSTIEFISMWKLIMFGKNIFKAEDGKLMFTPMPAMPEYLIPDDKCVKAMMLGKTMVTYHFADKKNYVPGGYNINSMKIAYDDGKTEVVSGGVAEGCIAMDIRDGKVASIDIEIA